MTCSKDGKVLVWHIIGPNHEVKLKATIDMQKEQVQNQLIGRVKSYFVQNWLNTWGGRFNKTDSLLLVAGVINDVILTLWSDTACCC